MQQHKFNASLQEFIRKRTTDCGSCGFLSEIIRWITENLPCYTNQLNDNLLTSDETTRKSADRPTEINFSRLWIYSHHIYNREKRRTLLDAARELDLTGFSAPGKPGVICVEGRKSNADDFWQQIRRLQWQRITLSHREDCAVLTDVCSQRRFVGFEEKCFVHPQSSSGHGTHLDRGRLLQFLQQNGCGDVFRYFFGVDGKEDSLVKK